jgi:anti-sigma-K factor RskA
MPAPTRTRPHPATRAGADSRLPWWALALPTLAFAALLVLILNPSDAQATTGDPLITQLFEWVQQLISR